MPEDLRIPADGGLHLGGWFFRAAGGRGPCVVMAHGLGATRRSGLAPFARRFQDAGLHVLAFDYRHFGDSDGKPRQLVAPKKQLEDWKSAIAYVRGRDDVDPDRVALWGTSYSGGHVVIAGARDGRVAAISALVPMMDPQGMVRDTLRRESAWWMARGVARGLVDAARGVLGMPPLLVPIVGSPGSNAVITRAGAEPRFVQLGGPDWVNAVCARITVTAAFPRPVNYAARIRCPILVQIADRDDIVPIDAAERAAALAGHRATVLRYPLGHLDVYDGPAFEQVVTDEVAFFARHLALRPSPSAYGASRHLYARADGGRPPA